MSISCNIQERLRKKRVHSFIVLCFFFVTFSSFAQTSKCTDEYLQGLWDFIPKKVFTIGTRTYDRDDFIRFALTKYNSIMMTMLDQQKAKKLAPALLKEMLEREILLKCAESDGIKPSKELTEKSMDDRYAGMNDVEKNNLKNFLSTKKLTYDEYKNNLSSEKKNQISAAINFWIKNFLTPKAKFTDKEVKAYYESCSEMVKASHILIKPNSFSKEDMEKARKQAESIRKKIENGEKFEKFTSNSSCDSSSLGEFGRGDMVKEFEDAVFKLKTGEISNVIKTPFGYHIVKLESKRKIKQPPFNTVKEKIRAELEKLKQQDLLIDAQQKMKEKEKVKIFFKIEG